MIESLLFCLDDRIELAGKILARANSWSVDNKIKMGDLNKQKFSDSELCVDYVSSVRGKRVYILMSATNSDDIMYLNLAIDAAKRGAAKEIIPILPYYPYARGDKKDQYRGPVAAKVIAEMLEQRGATSVITFDLHADQIQGFFNVPITHVEGKNVFVKEVFKLITPMSVLCGPDVGSSKRLKRMQKQLKKQFDVDVSWVLIDKERHEANKVDSMTVIGDVKGKHVIIIDDMVDTGGTLCKAAETLLQQGALSVRAFISHGVLSGPAYDNILNSKLEELVVSDSLPLLTVFNKRIGGFNSETTERVNTSNKIRQVSIAQQFGLAIAAINNNMSFEALKQNEKTLKDYHYDLQVQINQGTGNQV